MNGHSGHRVHVWLGDVFDSHGDVEVPGADGLIIGRRNKPPILIHECDCVHRPQVLIVLLRYFARPDVVLGEVSVIIIHIESTMPIEKPHLHDLFVRHSRQENVLLVVVRVEPNHIRNLSVAKAVETLSGLSIPEFHLPVISAGQELATVVRERKVFDSLYVSVECPQAVPMSVYVPQLESSVQSSGPSMQRLDLL